MSQMQGAVRTVAERDILYPGAAAANETNVLTCPPCPRRSHQRSWMLASST